MKKLATTKMTSKGQIVIPEAIRNELNLTSGTQFVVVGEGDSVILKTISPPSIKDLSKLMAKAQKEAKKVGLKKSDVATAIKKARKSK